MPSVSLSPTLHLEYENLFNTCLIRVERAQEIQDIIDTIDENATRYQDLGDALGIPWFFISVIHNMESSLNFTKHLHNGDPLTEQTNAVQII